MVGGMNDPAAQFPDAVEAWLERTGTYAQADLEDWAAARRMTSTSDDRAAGRRVA